MIVKVQIGNNEKMVVNVSCGEGKQSFKWLAGVIQARIKEFGILRKTFDTDAYIVTEMRNAEGDMINPKDAIFEHVQMVNGQTITAIISKSYPVDEWEYPEINDWMKVAYLESKVGKYYQNEISAWRENIEKLKSAKSFNNNLLSPRKLNSTIIKIGFDFTEDDIIAAFELDWGNMHWDWLTTNKQQINAIGDALKQQYSIICNVFAHYCGTGQVGQRYGMTLQEFMHLLHYMKVSHVDSSRSVIGKNTHVYL